MRALKEALLSFFAFSVVLYLYFVAAGAALVSRCGFFLRRDGPETLHRLKIAAKVTSRATIHGSL
jgi:hypothetical protein